LHHALRPRILDLFREAKHAGLTTSLDTNDDPEGRWGSELLEVLKYVDVFLPNEREAKNVAGTEDLERAMERLASLSSIVVVKRGRAPARCRQGSERWEQTPPRVEKVDDIGAGDTFDAGFIHLWLRHASLEECLRFAAIAAAYSVSREGGTEAFRDRHGLRNFMRRHWRGRGDVLSPRAGEVATGQAGKG
jgi:sugar/nucleoside kinase (ribokinase family)